MEYQKIQGKFHAHLRAATHLLCLVREVAYLWRLSWLWDWCSSGVLLYFRPYSTQTNCLHRRSPTLIRGTNLLLFSVFFFKSKYFYFYGISIFHLQGVGETIVRFFVKAFDLTVLDVTNRRKGEWGMGNGKRETGNGKRETAMEVWEQVVSRTLQQNALHISKKCNIRSWSLSYFLLHI